MDGRTSSFFSEGDGGCCGAVVAASSTGLAAMATTAGEESVAVTSAGIPSPPFKSDFMGIWREDAGWEGSLLLARVDSIGISIIVYLFILRWKKRFVQKKSRGPF